MSTRIEAPIVVYDAVCVLCCAGLRWIVRHDKGSHWRFLAMQSQRGMATLTAAGISALAPTSFLVLYRGQRYIESDACLVIARDIGGSFRVLSAACRLLPKSIRDAAYRLHSGRLRRLHIVRLEPRQHVRRLVDEQTRARGDVMRCVGHSHQRRIDLAEL